MNRDFAIMLVMQELFLAQGFNDEYRIDVEIDGKPITKTDQVRCCGNSVCPPIAAALVRANAPREGAQADMDVFVRSDEFQLELAAAC